MTMVSILQGGVPRYSPYLEVGEADTPSNISLVKFHCKLQAAFVFPKQVFHLLAPIRWLDGKWEMAIVI